VSLAGVVDVFGDGVFRFQTVAVRPLVVDGVIAVSAVEEVLVGVLLVRLAQKWGVVRFVDGLSGIRNRHSRFGIRKIDGTCLLNLTGRVRKSWSTVRNWRL
jgi:hypothetical protein